MKKQKSTNKVVTFGEVMMRLSPPGHQRYSQATQLDVHYGGSEANVAVSLAHFGIETEHVTCFPDNVFGRTAAAHLSSNGVNISHVTYSDGRLGLYFIEHGVDYRSSKVIYDRFDSAFAKLTPRNLDWESILSGATWFHWSGITPAISNLAAKACAEAIETARRLGIKISADINYRRNLWNYGRTANEIMPELISQSDVVFGGIVDFENCADVTASTFEEGCKRLQKNFPSVSLIASTERESTHSSHQKISAILWTKNSLLSSKAYELTNIIDRVGAGDAFVAGLIYGSLSQMDNQETLDFAVAASALKHTIAGDVNLVDATEVKTLAKGENVGKLLR
jgi:2-dehydro-3-deoxygluconokinase